MLNSIWCAMILVSIASALATGRIPELTNAVSEGAQAAVTLAISMLGMMCVWTGMIHIADRAGVTAMLSRVFRPIIRRLFPEYKADHSIQNRIAMSLSANLLGLGNAATPLGLAAVKEMAAKGNRQPTNGLMLFVVLNTASLQLIPTYAINLRSQYNCADPYDILPCIWLVSAISLLACLGASKVFSVGHSHA